VLVNATTVDVDCHRSVFFAMLWQAQNFMRTYITIFSLVLLIEPGPGSAQKALPQGVGAKTSPAAIESAISRLSAVDEAVVRGAIADLGKNGTRAAIAALCEFLDRGQPDAIADYALETLGKTRSPDATETLVSFTSHRRPSARLIAYQALSATRAPGTVTIVAQALSDSDSAIRSAAAAALGSLGAKEQLPRLFLALERGVYEAAGVIGQLGDAKSARMFTGYINRVPFAVILSGYQRFLERKDIEEKVKLEIVQALGEVAVPEAKRFLQTFLRNGGARNRPALQKTVMTTIARIQSDSKKQVISAAPNGGEGGVEK
jgi:HEAT repeat protein